jgi:hypothetical protein
MCLPAGVGYTTRMRVVVPPGTGWNLRCDLQQVDRELNWLIDRLDGKDEWGHA